MRVFVNSQSRVPGRAFSRRTRSLLPETDFRVAPAASFPTRAQPGNAAIAPRPTAPLIKSRREMRTSFSADWPLRLERFLCGFIIHHREAVARPRDKRSTQIEIESSKGNSKK